MKFDITVNQFHISTLIKSASLLLLNYSKVPNFRVSTLNMGRVIPSYKQGFLKMEWRRKSKFCPVFLRITLQYMPAGLSENFDIFNILWPRAERAVFSNSGL